MAVEMALLANQLSQLGRDLQTEITLLGEMEEAAVEAEGQYRELDAAHEDELARAFLRARGSNAEARKAEARLECIPSRKMAEQAMLNWNQKKAALRTQHASLQALHRRIEVGRSLLSREKSLIGLELSGIS
jgi:hypothetical protein